MDLQVSYNQVMDVCLSWDQVKMLDEYVDLIGGTLLMELFDLEPKSKGLLGFTDTEDVQASPRFKVLATTMVDMFDMAVNFLGPDLDPLTDDLIELGGRHVKYGVDPKFLPLMGTALFRTLKKCLGSRITKRDLESWKVIFDYMISMMIEGMKRKGLGRK